MVGLSLVKSKEGYGFVNNDGEEIIPCKYEDAHGFCSEQTLLRLN